MSTAPKYVGQTAYRFQPIVVTQKSRLELQHPAVRLWRELFADVPLKHFTSKMKFRISRACNNPHDNPSARFRELFVEMKRAGMPLSDLQAIVADLDCYSRSLFRGPVTEDCVHKASMAEILADCEEDIAQHQLAQDVTPENASAYADVALRAIGKMQELVVVARSYAERRTV
jgi:hypothetical protein